jgi:benzoylformate decarboxylase
MMETVARSLPPRAYVADESMTSAGYLREALRDRPDVDYLSCLSRGLGSGWPGGIAAKRAFPDRPVVAISADGAAMYVAQALWTAAHEKLDVVFVVANNRAYRILKLNLAAHRKRFGEPSGPFPFMDLGDPPIRFDDLARSMGVAGHRAIDASSLGSALAVAFAASGSHLIDVEIPGDIDG